MSTLTMHDQEFQSLVRYIQENFGINLTQKRNLVEGRLGNHLQACGYTTYQDYLDQVFTDATGTELADLVNRLTTNHTFFMREANHFDYLKTRILPELERSIGDHDLRIWSAGCSSGEEPYTLAMMLDEYFGCSKRSWDTRILATDISAKVLNQARQGIYSSSALETLPPAWPNRYFRKTGPDNWEVIPRIRNDIVFRSLNLIQDVFPLKNKFHVIFCRNVMIYFDRQTKKELVGRFHNLTLPGGHLFIGHAESIPREDTAYHYLQPAIYQKV